MMINENITSIKGLFHIELKSSDGSIIDTYTNHNLVVNGGKALLAHSLVGSDIDNKKISKFGVGDSIAVSSGDMIGLQGTNIFKKVIVGYEFPVYNQAKINFEVGLTEANGIDIKEFGLFSADGTLFNRVTWNKNVLKSSSFALSGYFLISF